MRQRVDRRPEQVLSPSRWRVLLRLAATLSLGVCLSAGFAADAFAVDWNSSAYRADNYFYTWGYAPARFYPSGVSPNLGAAKGNCTWYAHGRARELGYVGSGLNVMSGNAGTWGAAAAGHFVVDTTPSYGAIAESSGHVAFVERVNADGTMLISESSYARPDQIGTAYDYEYKTRDNVAPSTFLRYIHVLPSAQPPSLGWMGPWAGAPVVACEPGELWLQANGNGTNLSAVSGKMLWGGTTTDAGVFTWTGGSDFRREFWYPVNTSQKVTLQGIATSPAGTGTSDYPRYITEEKWFVSGDWNGDGKTDVARMVDDGSSTMSLWAGISDGQRFNYTRACTSSSWNRLLTQCFSGDVDGNGKDEICAFFRYGDNASGLWVFRWNGTGFTATKVWNATSGKEWYRLKPFCADIDGDRKDEVITAFDYDGWNGWDTGFFVWQAEGTSLAEPTSPWTVTTNGWWDWSASNFLPGDFDADGRDEIAAYYNYSPGDTGLWLFDGYNGSTFTTITNPWRSGTGWFFGATKPAVGDFDGDKRAEIANLYNYAGWNSWAVGWWVMGVEPNGTISNSLKWTTPAGGWDWTRTRPLAGDIEGDGSQELMAFYDYGSRTAREAWGLWLWRPDRGYVATKTWNKATGNWGLTPDLNQVFPAGPAPAATSITIKTNATTARIGSVPILSGTVTPSGMIGRNIVVWVKKPGKSFYSYSSNRTVYALNGSAAWQYKYFFKPGMTKGVYYFKASAPAPGFATSAGFAGSNSSVVSIRLR